MLPPHGIAHAFPVVRIVVMRIVVTILMVPRLAGGGSSRAGPGPHTPRRPEHQCHERSVTVGAVSFTADTPFVPDPSATVGLEPMPAQATAMFSAAPPPEGVKATYALTSNVVLQSHVRASSTSLVAVCDVIRDAGTFDCRLILDERDRLVE